MAWTTPRTWVTNEDVTATLMNTHVRDNFKAIGDAWTSYTPTWAGVTTNPTIGNGTNVGRYIQAGKLVSFYVTITMGSTTAYGSGAWSVTLPVAPVASRGWTFQGQANDASAGLFDLCGIVQSGSVVDLRCDPTTAGNQLRVVNSASPFTWTTSDLMYIGGTYEAA